MDNNNVPTTQAQAQPQAQSTLAVPQSNGPAQANRKLWIIIALIVVLVAVIVGVAYWYRQNQIAATAAVEQFQKTTQLLDEELNSLDIGDIEQDFSEVDADLQSL